MRNKKLDLLLASITLASIGLIPGCKSPQEYRQEADLKAYKLIEKAEKDLFGRDSVFTIETAEDQLRRRLMEAQGLPYSGKASLGIENLEKPDFWPEKDFPAPLTLQDQQRYKEPMKVSLLEALQMAASHNFEYQAQKESVFASALTLDLQDHNFDTIFSLGGSSTLSADTDAENPTIKKLSNSATLGADRKLDNGAVISANIFANLAYILAPDDIVSHSSGADASISVPLLRGSGKLVATEGITQAQRNLIYAVYDFERYKKSFAVDITREYYSVLEASNRITNNKANYESVKTSAARARKLAEAGRTTNIQRDQAIQQELSARNSLLSSQEAYKNTLDSFKVRLGLPADAMIELDSGELDNVIAYTEKALALDLSPARDAKIEFNENPGPFEIDENEAVDIALKSRLDLVNANSKVYDSQRAVAIAADRLRAELTLLGKAQYSGLDKEDMESGNYSAMLTIDLPLERTSERNSYRNSLISLQRAVRSVQTLEDNIKLGIRRDLRNLKDRRNSLQIQAESVRLAEDRVRSTTMFLEAGRIEMRDLLDAENSLLSARTSITSSVIAYRLAELEIQRDLEKLNIDQNGLWVEYDPKTAQDTTTTTEPVSSTEDQQNNS